MINKRSDSDILMSDIKSKILDSSELNRDDIPTLFKELLNEHGIITEKNGISNNNRLQKSIEMSIARLEVIHKY
jgi:hypothetical protein